MVRGHGTTHRARPDAPRLEARRCLAVLGAGAGLGLIALLFDASSLLVPAIALVLLGALTPLWVRLAAHGLRAQRRLGAERVIEQQPLDATIELRRGWFGAPGAELSDPATPGPIPLGQTLSPIHGASRARVRIIARFPRRGLHRLPTATIRVRDPLDLARVEMSVSGGADPVLVLPRTEPVRWTAAGQMRRVMRSEGEAGSEALAAVDLEGLRPYRPGTPASRIYWPAVARGAGLLERRLRADGESRPLVVLDTRTGRPGGEEAVNAAVRAAGSLVLALAAGGGCGLLLPGEQRPSMVDRELVAWPTAHARLAVVESGPAARPPGNASAVAGRSGVMIYVAAEGAPCLAALRRLPTSRPVLLVVPVGALRGGRLPGYPAAVQVLSVSGCTGFVLGPRRPRRSRRRAPTEVGAT